MGVLKKHIPLVFFILSFLWVLKVLLLPGYPDFYVHYYGAQHVLEGQNPYIEDKHYFTYQVYPPFDMVFFLPFAFLPFLIAAKLWIIISIAALCYSLYFCYKIFQQNFFSKQNLLFSGLFFLAFPVKFTLGMGQINAVLLFFLMLFIYYFSIRNTLRAGTSLAFPLALKFFPLLIIPYLVFLKRVNVIMVTICMLILMFVTSLILIQSNIQHDFFFHTLPGLLSSWKGDYYNQALSGVLMRQFGKSSLSEVLRVIIPVVMLTMNGVVIIMKKKTNTGTALEISSIICLSLLINTFSWQHHFIFLLFPYYTLYLHSLKKKNKKLLAVLTISYLFVALNLRTPATVPIIIQSHVFWGTFILWCSVLHVLRKNYA